MPERMPDEQLLGALTEVFRTHGYEGTTLALVSKATGLQKSSLYHRFPGGKEQMAVAVLNAAVAHVAGHVLAPLRGTGSIRMRVKETASRIADFYGQGKKACLLDTLSVGFPPGGSISSLLKGAHDYWIESFAFAAKEAGLPPKKAKARAAEALVRIEGALVVSRISGDERSFQRALADLPDLLCKS